MRRATLLLLLAVFGYSAEAQFTLIPQAGIENPVTKISYNDLRSFQPVVSLQPQVSICAEYKFKNGVGIFTGAGTSRSAVSYNFLDPETGMKAYQASTGNTQLQLQAGLKYSTKPIYFNKQVSHNRSSKTPCGMNRSCGNHTGSTCCHRAPGCSQKTRAQNKGMYISMQPLAGFAFMPSNQPDLVTKSSGMGYTYNAGNIKKALLAGVGFELGYRHTKYVTLSINYFKGLGNEKTTVNSFSGTKAILTTLNSRISGWNTSIGLPISLVKRPFSRGKRSPECREQNRVRCGYWKMFQ